MVKTVEASREVDTSKTVEAVSQEEAMPVLDNNTSVSTEVSLHALDSPLVPVEAIEKLKSLSSSISFSKDGMNQTLALMAGSIEELLTFTKLTTSSLGDVLALAENRADILDGIVNDLTAKYNAREAELLKHIATLNEQHAARESELSAVIAARDTALAERDATIDNLEVAIAKAEEKKRKALAALATEE